MLNPAQIDLSSFKTGEISRKAITFLLNIFCETRVGLLNHFLYSLVLLTNLTFAFFFLNFPLFYHRCYYSSALKKILFKALVSILSLISVLCSQLDCLNFEILWILIIVISNDSYYCRFLQWRTYSLLFSKFGSYLFMLPIFMSYWSAISLRNLGNIFKQILSFSCAKG